MNEQNIDKLFRETLAGHQQAPPAELLEKLEIGLVRQRRSAWFQFARVAAALVVIAVSVYLLTNLGSSSESPREITTKNQPSGDLVPLVQPAPIESTLEEPPVIADRIVPSVQLAAKETTLPVEVAEPDQPAPQTDKAVFAADEVREKPQRFKITITYKKADQITKAPEPSTLAKAPPKQQKSKKKNKFWHKAKMVDPSFTLAGLRATKDQLLAINKREKNKESKPN
jgi:hypothetical protein